MDGFQVSCAFAFDKGFFEGLSGGLAWIEECRNLVTNSGELTDTTFLPSFRFAGREIFVVFIGLISCLTLE